MDILKNWLKERISKTYWFQTEMGKTHGVDFLPYENTLNVGGASGRFFYATPQAKDWYDPMKPYSRLEYEWVIKNVSLNGQNILDGGAHHGHYSVVLALAASEGANIVSVDPIPMNCLLTEINLRLNQKSFRIEQCALSGHNGKVHFSHESNGRIITDGGLVVESRTIDSILPDANVVKLDVEGAEYEIVPIAVDKLNNVHTWIIEIHPYSKPHPDEVIKPLIAKGYEILYVNRDSTSIDPYRLGTYWSVHSTIFARR